MKCLDRFNQKMVLGGSTLRNENIKNSRELLRDTFQNDASYRLGIYIWELGRIGAESYDDISPIEIRIFNRKYSSANGVTMKFQTLFDTPIIVGDIVYDSTTDDYLICTESFNINDVHWQGKFTLCNWILKWQNSNGDILEYPCFDINATQYNSGEQGNRQFIIGSSQHIVMLPCDENTVILNTPQRFFLDKDPIHPTCFQITQNDTTSYNYGKKGICKITLLECQHNPDTDRIDLGICDYIDKDDMVTDNANDVFVSKSVISYDTTVIKSGGSSQRFTGSFFDSNGDEVVGVVPRWKIHCPFYDALQIQKSGNSLVIGIDNDAYVDEEFKIELSDSDGNYSSTLLIRVASLL